MQSLQAPQTECEINVQQRRRKPQGGAKMGRDFQTVLTVARLAICSFFFPNRAVPVLQSLALLQVVLQTQFFYLNFLHILLFHKWPHGFQAGPVHFNLIRVCIYHSVNMGVRPGGSHFNVAPELNASGDPAHVGQGCGLWDRRPALQTWLQHSLPMPLGKSHSVPLCVGWG